MFTKVGKYDDKKKKKKKKHATNRSSAGMGGVPLHMLPAQANEALDGPLGHETCTSKAI